MPDAQQPRLLIAAALMFLGSGRQLALSASPSR